MYVLKAIPVAGRLAVVRPRSIAGGERTLSGIVQAARHVSVWETVRNLALPSAPPFERWLPSCWMPRPKLDVVFGFDGHWVVLFGADGVERVVVQQAFEGRSRAVIRRDQVAAELEALGPDAWCAKWNVPREALGGPPV
jgi:hypothetical protein